MTTTARHEPNAFWRFSLRAYRRPSAEAAFLALQDEAGTDTNIELASIKAVVSAVNRGYASVKSTHV